MQFLSEFPNFFGKLSRNFALETFQVLGNFPSFGKLSWKLSGTGSFQPKLIPEDEQGCNNGMQMVDGCTLKLSVASSGIALQK